MSRSVGLSAVMLLAACQGAAPCATSCVPGVGRSPIVALAVFDDSSDTEFTLSSRSDRLPLRCLASHPICLNNVRPTQVLLEGVWTVAFDIPGDEVARIEALVSDHEAVFLVWNGRILATWEAGDITELQKRYGKEMYMPNPGFRDEATAIETAKRLQDVHSTGARAW